MNDIDSEKTQRLVNLLKQREELLREDKSFRAAYNDELVVIQEKDRRGTLKEDLKELDKGIKAIAAELDEGEKETIDLA